VTRLFIPSRDNNRRSQANLLPHLQPPAIIKLVQNALSDWGSKAVAVVHREAATVQLTRNTLTAQCWAIAATAIGGIITSDQRTARYALIDRVARERLEERGLVKHVQGIGRMANVEVMWSKESTRRHCASHEVEASSDQQKSTPNIWPQCRVGSRIPGDDHHHNYHRRKTRNTGSHLPSM
jgi:hypothetical protein